MAHKQQGSSTPISAVKHSDKRANIPTEELRDFVIDDEQTPKSLRYPRDTSLDPQLVWQGKDEKDGKEPTDPRKGDSKPEGGKKPPEGEKGEPPENPEPAWWAELPEEARRAITGGSVEDVPAKYRALLERYRKWLAEKARPRDAR